MDKNMHILLFYEQAVCWRDIKTEKVHLNSMNSKMVTALLALLFNNREEDCGD